MIQKVIRKFNERKENAENVYSEPKPLNPGFFHNGTNDGGENRTAEQGPNVELQWRIFYDHSLNRLSLMLRIEAIGAASVGTGADLPTIRTNMSWCHCYSAFDVMAIIVARLTLSIFRILILVLLSMTGCAPKESNAVPSILLFNGAGTSPNDVAAVKSVLVDFRLDYTTVNSEQLNKMNESQLMAYRLLIVPGGHYTKMGESLTPSTTTNIHNAVQGGLNYMGICAGGLLAGDAECNSLNLTSGVRFGFYKVVNQGVHKSVVPVVIADEPTLEHYWEDGPEFTGWGDIIGKYPDGTPAIVEGLSGKGWVILCGVHPEAPAKWRKGMNFNTPANIDNAYSGKLINAALNRTMLPHH